MFELIPNEQKTAVQFLFTNFYTEKIEFVTAFDLNESKKIANELIKIIKQLEKENEKTNTAETKVETRFRESKF